MKAIIFMSDMGQGCLQVEWLITNFGDQFDSISISCKIKLLKAWPFSSVVVKFAQRTVDKLFGGFTVHQLGPNLTLTQGQTRSKLKPS